MLIYYKPRKERCIKMSVNGKYVYDVEIDTVKDAKDIVSIATRLQGKIVLKSGSHFSVNAKSLLGVLSLGITKGVTVTISAEGSDEESAVEGLVELINSNFSEMV